MFRFDKVSPFLTSGFAFALTFFSRLVFGFLFLPLCGAELIGQFMSFIFRIFFPKVMVKLTRWATRHFVTLVGDGMHLTESNP